MNSSIVESGDQGVADACPVISTILWVIVDKRDVGAVGSRLLYAISPADAKRSGPERYTGHTSA